MDLEIFTFPIDRSIADVVDALFWHVIEIYWKKPHCVNKRLCGADLHDLADEVSEAEMIDIKALATSKDCGFGGNVKRENLVARRLLPKNISHFESMNEILWKDVQGRTAVFIPRGSNGVRPSAGQLKYPHVTSPYAIALRTIADKTYLDLKVGKDSLCEKGTNWLRETLMPTLARWMKHCSPEKPLTQSLRLADLQAYNECYNHLKSKYGKWLVKVWPERTDPTKFVYEDIATAAYLLTLWKEDRKLGSGVQTFVDLGCGNGLLVYLLTSEGHAGYGIDVRRRQIWDLYGPNVKLMERAFEPSDSHLFPDADWLIGNHSDELTPWIPVIAANIPCCAWDFRGKYQRNDAGLSTYRSYIRYMLNVGRKCGFNVEEDVLKIPSTKRVCIVGRRDGDIPEDVVRDNIGKLLGPTVSQQDNTIDSPWIDGFSQRQAKEKIKNCTALPRTSIDGIVTKITGALLKEENYVDTLDGKKWNAGGSQPIPACAAALNEDDLHLLKSQCGGLQTLLRNHRHIFRVENCNVSFRTWTPEELRQNDKPRKNVCWFYQHHPDGCPLLEHLCRYSHSVPENG